MRNSLLATSVGLTMIHFRREIEERPPLGGLVMTALGLGYAFAGGACHLYAVARLRSSLLSPLGTFAACAHAVAPPSVWNSPAAQSSHSLCPASAVYLPGLHAISAVARAKV